MPCRLETNGSPAVLGSLSKTSSAAPAMWPDSRPSRSASWSTTMPRHRLRNRLRGPHLRELLRAEEPGVPGPTVDVQAHRLGHRQQLVEAVAALGVAERELVGDVVEVDLHAQRLGHDGELAADVAVADDAERAAAHLVRALGRLVPDAGVHGRVLVGEVAGQRDDLGDDELDDAAGVGERGVEDGHPALGGDREVDLVGADAEGADGQQVGRRLEHARGDVGLGADAEQLHAGHPRRQLGLVQGALDGLDLDPALGEQPDALGVDVLQQQRFHARSLGSRASADRPGSRPRRSRAPARRSCATVRATLGLQHRVEAGRR